MIQIIFCNHSLVNSVVESSVNTCMLFNIKMIKIGWLVAFVLKWELSDKYVVKLNNP